MNLESYAESTTLLDQLPPIINKRFEVISLLGRGGVGVVLKCRDNVLNNIVSVKLLLDDVSDGVAQRFQREAITSARLNHRNIVRVSDFGQNDDGRLYLVMEYLEGGTLLDEIDKNSGYTVSDALPIWIKICEGLSHAHNQGVLHRDVKPSNVMMSLEPNGKVVPKLVDFGLAKLKSGDKTETTGGRVFGSPSYLSPEAVRGGEIDFRTDVYSLGCLIFETLAGKPPFLANTAFETLNQKLNKKAPSLFEATGVEYPTQLEEILEKSLAKDPDDRYSDVASLKNALEELYELDEYDEEDEETEEINIRETLILAPFEPKRKLKTTNVLITIGLGLALLVTLYFFVRDFSQLFSYSNPLAGKPQTVVEKRPKLLQTLQFDSDNKLVWNGSGDDKAQKSILLLSSTRRFKILRIKKTDVTGKKIAFLKASKLTGLDLDGCRLDAAAMKELSGIKSLRYLNLYGAKGISDEGIEYLKNLRRLQRLVIGKTEISDKIFTVIPHLRNLEYLDISSCHRLSGKGVESLSKLPKLKELRIGGARFNPLETKSLAYLKSIKNLNSLFLSHMAIENENIEQLNSLPITELHLYSVPVSNPGLLKLKDQKSINRLTVERSYMVTIDGINELRSKLPNCTITIN